MPDYYSPDDWLQHDCNDRLPNTFTLSITTYKLPDQTTLIYTHMYMLSMVKTKPTVLMEDNLVQHHNCPPHTYQLSCHKSRVHIEQK